MNLRGLEAKLRELQRHLFSVVLPVLCPSAVSFGTQDSQPFHVPPSALLTGALCFYCEYGGEACLATVPKIQILDESETKGRQDKIQPSSLPWRNLFHQTAFSLAPLPSRVHSGFHLTPGNALFILKANIKPWVLREQLSIMVKEDILWSLLYPTLCQADWGNRGSSSLSLHSRAHFTCYLLVTVWHIRSLKTQVWMREILLFPNQYYTSKTKKETTEWKWFFQPKQKYFHN